MRLSVGKSWPRRLAIGALGTFAVVLVVVAIGERCCSARGVAPPGDWGAGLMAWLIVVPLLCLGAAIVGVLCAFTGGTRRESALVGLVGGWIGLGVGLLLLAAIRGADLAAIGSEAMDIRTLPVLAVGSAPYLVGFGLVALWQRALRRHRLRDAKADTDL